MEAKIAYVDKIDFEHHIENALGGTLVFATEQDLRENKPCTLECGILEVEITTKRAKNMEAKITKIAYMDKTDFEHVENALGGTLVFATEQDLKENKAFWNEHTGVLEVEITIKRVIQETNFHLENPNGTT